MVHEQAGRQKWLRIILGVSLALNLFFVAFWGGQMLRSTPRVAGGDDPLARILAVAEANLPPSDSKLFRETLLKEQPRYAQAVKKLVQARQEMLKQVSADPFDPAATLTALNATQTAWTEFMEAIGRPMVDAVGLVSPEGRRRVVADQKAKGIMRVP